LGDYEGVITAAVRAQVAAMRVAHLATAHDNAPALVPICFVLQGDRLYTAIDAKPKSVPPERLRRVRHLRANPRAAILADHYDEDWSRLWFVLLEGSVRLLERGAEHARAIAALRRKYAQYRAPLLADGALVIALDVAAWRYWRAAADPRPLRTPSAVRRSGSRGSRLRDRRGGSRRGPGRRTTSH
jgi:PPOX class probable F420-dependent enzyme